MIRVIGEGETDEHPLCARHFAKHFIYSANLFTEQSLKDYPSDKAKKTEAEGWAGVGVVKYLANAAGELSGRAVNGTQSGGVFTP